MYKNKGLKYYIINKPYGVLSQFTDEKKRPTLESIYNFPRDVYPVGRLDMDSEGLLILTNDKNLTDYLLNPENNHEREYLVQVEGIPAKEDLEKLARGVIIKGRKSLPAKAELIPDPKLPLRIPPIRERKNIPTSWLKIILTEGKNRQVRRMTAVIGFPTLRLVRIRIKNILLKDVLPGKFRELTEKEVSKIKH